MILFGIFQSLSPLEVGDEGSLGQRRPTDEVPSKIKDRDSLRMLDPSTMVPVSIACRDLH
jgi:hypothetical protein